MARAPRPRTIPTKQARIAELARQMPETALFSLSHHIDLDWMREAYRRTNKRGAAGIDGVTASDVEDDLDTHLQTLIEGLKSMHYRAPPVRRVMIPKAGGKERPIGVPTLMDKVLQRAVHMVLEPLYEQDFYDFSYGFRPGRSAHDALQALDEALFTSGSPCWVLDVDVKSFFDTIDRRALRDLLKLRVADGPVIRAVGKWLRAGVMEGGVVHHPDRGTPQGGVISPLLANIYLHHVLDHWWVTEVLPRLRGKATLIRYADDFVMVMSSKEDADKVMAALPKRLGRYGLTIHPDKSRLIRFRRPRRDGGSDDGPRPGTFDFLGFTHYWGKSRRGKRIVKRRTARKRFARAAHAIHEWTKRHRHLPLAVQRDVLAQKLRGHYGYYGITGNIDALDRFHRVVVRTWRRWLDRRNQQRAMTWERMNHLLTHQPLPRPAVYRSVYRSPANATP